MQRPPLASWRFFHAFYRWNRLNAGVHLPEHPSWSPRQARHTSTTIADNPLSNVRADESTVVRKVSSRHDSYREGSQSAKPHWPSWALAAVETSEQKPFVNLAGWEAVLRHRSSLGIIAELAIPVAQVKALQTEYGEDFGKLHEQCGVKAELGSAGTVHGLQSLLISGNESEITKAEPIFGKYWERGRQQALNSPLSQTVRTWISERRVQTPEQLPSSALPPWDFALRSLRDNGDSVLELVVPDKLFARNQKHISNIIQSHQVKSEVGPLIYHSDGRVRSIVISGDNRKSYFALERIKRLEKSKTIVKIPKESKDFIINDFKSLRSSIRSKHGGSISRRLVWRDNGTEEWVVEIIGSPNGEVQEVVESINEALKEWQINGKPVDAFSKTARGAQTDGDDVSMQRENRSKIVPGAATDAPASEPESPAGPKRKAQLVEDLKSTFRTFTHPVAVITTQVPLDDGNGEGSRISRMRGVTVSSFNVVTLDPEPFISFNIRVPSRTWHAMLRSRECAIHVLSASPEGAAFANAFTLPYEDPSEPFHKLHSLGAYMGVKSRAPHIWLKKAVTTHIRVQIMQNMCTNVGDHVVVVARVIRVYFQNDLRGKDGLEKVEALAYSNKAYRAMGNALQPVDLSEMRNVTHDGVDATNTSLGDGVVASEDIPMDNSVDVSVEISDEIDHQPAEINHTQSKGLSDLDEIAMDKYFETMERGKNAGNFSEVRSTTVLTQDMPAVAKAKTSVDPQSGQQLSRTDVSNIAPTSAQVDNSLPARSNPIKHTSVRPRGFSTYSTLSPSEPCQTRSYSTKPSDLSGPSSASSSGATIDLESLVTDPSLLKSSVADFLNIHPETYVTPPRMKGLLRAQKIAAAASRTLENAEKLQPDVVHRLQHTVTRNERRVATTLALRAARDLKHMLDRGRVDVERARWLEGAVERGQAALLAEIDGLKRAVEQRQVGEERAREMRKKLDDMFEVLRTEGLRLRAMVDEDELFEETVANVRQETRGPGGL